MVGASGVGTSTGAGTPDASTGSGTGVVTASALAAYPPGEATKVSSPIGEGCKNSSEREPPMAPLIAETMT